MDATSAVNRRAVAAAYFLMFFGAGIYLPSFPLYLDWLGFSGPEMGVVVGIQPILRHVASIAFGWIADRRQIRHTMAVATAAISIACFVPMVWVTSFRDVVVVMAAISIFHGPIIAAIDSTVMDHLDELGGDYGRLRAWGSIAFILAAAGSGMAVWIWSAAIVPYLFLGPAVLLPLAMYRLPRTQSTSEHHARPPWRLLTPPLTAFLACVFLAHLSSGAWGGFFPIHLSRLGLPTWLPGVTWGLAVAAEVVLFRWGHVVLAVLTPSRLVAVSLAMTVLRWLGTAFVTWPAGLVLLQLGHAFAFSAFHLAAMLLINRLVPPESSTSGQALYGFTGFGLGGSAGLVLAGMLLAPLGTDGLFVFEAGIAALGLLPAIVLLRLVPR
jgi:PPP family 3-phenylpropionic acid transporter